MKRDLCYQDEIDEEEQRVVKLSAFISNMEAKLFVKDKT